MNDSTFDMSRLPREIWDNITGRLGSGDRGNMALASKQMEEICRMQHWADIRFQSQSQSTLWNQLQCFIMKHKSDHETLSDRPLFTEYIKGATIELSDPPATAQSGNRLGSFRHAHLDHRQGFEPDTMLHQQILFAISLMPNLKYLSLCLSGSQVTEDQLQGFRQELINLRRMKKRWKSVKDLCVITGGDDAIDIVSDMVPKLEGLHMEGNTMGGLFQAAAIRHRNLKRLAVALDEEEDVQVEAFNPSALQRILDGFPHLDTLILHELTSRGSVSDADEADSQIDASITIFRDMRTLRRLSLQCQPDIWYHRELLLPLGTDVTTSYLAWYSEMIRRFESVSSLHSIAILAHYPDYYKGERTTGNQKFRISKGNAGGVSRAAWPFSIRG